MEKSLEPKKSWLIKSITGEEIIIVERRTSRVILKETRKQPHIVGQNKHFKLWKFFMSLVDNKMQFLKEPRYMIQKGHKWFKIKSMEII